ncbi:MAG: hypothetical protein ABSB67_20570, partial [Bryobacteraceae bacterium]
MSIGARRNFRLSRIALKIVSNPVRRAVGYLCILMSFALLMVIAAAQTTTTTHVTGTVRSASLPIPGA